MHDRYYIGGGNIAAVLGISPLQTPLSAWHGIMGTSPGHDQELEEFFARRKAVEPFAAVVLKQRGFKILHQNVRYTDPEYPFLKSEIDAEVEGDGVEMNCEFKSVHPLATKGWGEDGGDRFPDYVNVQLQHGLGIRKREHGLIGAIIGFDDDRFYPTPAAHQLIPEIRARAVAFWENHVLKKIPPPATTVEDVLTFVTPDPSLTLAIEDLGLQAEWRELIDLRAANKQKQDEEENLHARIKIAMGEATTLTLNGKPVATWNRNKDSTSVDYKGAHEFLYREARKHDRETADGIVATYTGTKPGPRVFRFKEKK